MSEYVFRSYGLTKYYGRQKAVDEISMNVKRGDIYGFIGRNGAGKTTMMKMITGLVNPTGGDMEIFGGKESRLPAGAGNRVDSIIEEPCLYPHMTAYENLEYKKRLHGIRNPNVIKDILEQVGLTSAGKKKAAKFSMGMKQRLGIGMALLIKPEFLLLDEPINGLDPQGTVEIRNLIVRLNKENNITILISSHILDELSKVATCYGIIEHGRLIEEISKEALIEKCVGYIEIKPDDLDKAGHVLQNKLKITDYTIGADRTIKVHDTGRKPSDINTCLVQNQVVVESVILRKQSLEDYFINLEKVGTNNA